MQKINISNLPSANKFFIEPSTQSHLKTLWRASKVAQRVKVTAAKPGNLRLIPRTHMIGGGNQLPQSCPLTYIHGTYMPINTGCTHKFCKSNNNHSEDVKLCVVFARDPSTRETKENCCEFKANLGYIERPFHKAKK